MTSIINEFKQKWKGIYPREEEQAIVRLIMEKVCHLQPYQFLAGVSDEQLSAVQRQKLLEIGERLSHEEPIQYILGEAEFQGLNLQVAPGVLIPRPETGELVDLILKEQQESEKRLIDIGTGSGCIAIALSRHKPQWKIYGADISSKALQIAQKNNQLQQTDVHFLQTDILNITQADLCIPDNLDIIVSNPPYIMEKEKNKMSLNVLNFEPEEALFVPDNDPLLFYRNIARIGQKKLKQKGYLYFEINAQCGTMTCKLLEQENYHNIQLVKDWYGKDRIVKAMK